MKANIICGLLFVLLFNCLIFAQQKSSKEIFYEAEHHTWLESIELAQNHSAQENFDVLFYHLDVNIEIFRRYIDGSLLCRFKAVEDNVTSIELDLTDSLTVFEITGNVSTFTRDSDKIQIQLANSLNTGEQSEVIVYYRGIPPQYYVNEDVSKGLVYETHGNNEPVIASLTTPYLAHQWWPCKDGPGDKPDSVYIDITIPNISIGGYPVIVSSNGLLESVTTNPFSLKKTFKWRERYPIPPYYVMCAISNFRHFSQTYNGNDGTTFPLDYYSLPEDYENSLQGVAELPEAIDLFSELFGSYPFNNEKYGMTQLGFYGAIENQTNTIQNELSQGWFDISVHELSHQWFGDMITCKDWHHAWMNEGFATYCEALYKENKHGSDYFKNYMETISYYDGGSVYLNNVSSPANVFISIIYRKGAWVLHMLRGVLGDEMFFDCLSQYAGDQRFRFDHATTEDFKGLCENASGLNLNYFFDQWIYDEYYPRYNYNYEYDPVGSNLILNINQRQGDNGWRPLFVMPVQIKLNYTNGSSEIITVMNDEQFQEFNIPVAEQVSSIEFDPDNWILKEAIISGVEETEEVPIDFVLYQNYPNPFNPETVISFKLAVGSQVSLKVYDVRGREVAELINDKMEIGNHEVQFNINDISRGLTSGIYIYELVADHYHFSKKMILLK